MSNGEAYAWPNDQRIQTYVLILLPENFKLWEGRKKEKGSVFTTYLGLQSRFACLPPSKRNPRLTVSS